MNNKKRKFIFTTTLLLSIGFIATSLFSYFVARSLLDFQISNKSLPLMTENIYTKIEHDFVEHTYIASIMANDTFVHDWIKSGENNASKIENYLRNFLSDEDVFTSFFISENTKRYYHPNRIDRFISEDNPDEQWYFYARAMKKDYDIIISEDEVSNERLTVFINHRVVDKNSNFLGVIGVGLSLDFVTKLIHSYEKKYQRRVYFLDKNGRVVLSNKNLNKLQKNTILKTHLDKILNLSNSAITYKSRRDKVFLNSLFIKELNWYLIVEEDDIFSKTQIQNALIINILGAIVITIIILYFANFTFQSYQKRVDEINSSLAESVRMEVSKRIKIVKEKNIQESILIQQSKIVEVGEMMASIIHQWKHPLNTIGLLSSQIGLFNAKREKPYKELEEIEFQIMEKLNFMNETLNDFQNFFKPSKEKEKFNVYFEIKKVKEMFKMEFGDRNIKIIIHKSNSFEVVGYKSEFIHVVLNIFNNAKENFTQKKQIDSYIDVSFKVNNNIGVIKIRDNGGGIAKELFPNRLFEPYITTKNSYNMGYGLYICKNIIEKKMSGKIYVRNHKDGAEFVIKIVIISNSNWIL